MKKIITLILVFTATLLFSQVPNYVPTNGLVGYWPFTGNANDLSGNGNNGTNNGATLIADRFDNPNSAYSFDGNDFISLAQPFYNGSTTVNTLTYSFWFDISQYPTNNYTFSGKEGFWRSVSCGINNNGIISFGGSQPSPQGYFSISSANAATLNQWNNVIVTFQNGNLNLYFNGILTSTNTIPYSSLNYSYLQAGNSTSTNYFGAVHPVSPGVTNYLIGKIDDFCIWNRALTQQEITNLYISNLSSQDFAINDINIYPNPTTSLLNFKSAIQVEKILIYNMLGQLVQQEKVNALEGAINIEKLAQGTYLVKVNDIDKGYTIIKN